MKLPFRRSRLLDVLDPLRTQEPWGAQVYEKIDRPVNSVCWRIVDSVINNDLNGLIMRLLR